MNGSRRIAAMRGGDTSTEPAPGAAPGRHGQEPTPGLAVCRRPREWTINGDFFAFGPTGVARYAREVSLALDALVRESHPLTNGLELEIVAPREAPGNFTLTSIPVRVVPEYKRPRIPQLWVQAQLPFEVRHGLLSLCNLAPVSVRRQIVCIHDLHTRLMPLSYGRWFRLAHRIILPVLGRRAAAITTVSAFSRSQIVCNGIARSDKVTVSYNGSDHAARWQPDRSSIEFGSRPFALCLGQTQKYKNLELLLELAPQLDRIGLDLCVAGEVGAPLVGQAVPDRPPNLRLLGRVGDDDLAKALSQALCFLFPSRIEGFGLPAVEAMAMGCPVVASSAPCLPEICGEAALYADPDDPPSWLATIDRLRNDEVLRRHMIGQGRKRARMFSWRAVAEAYLGLMADIDGCIQHASTQPRPAQPTDRPSWAMERIDGRH